MFSLPDINIGSITMGPILYTGHLFKFPGKTV